MVFDAPAYWLTNAHVPQCLVDIDVTDSTREGFCLVNLKISQGKIEKVVATTSLPEKHDMLDGTFDMALERAISDSQKHWQAEDLYRRMEFGLKCSYAHGTQAIRTHIDSYGKQAEISLDVFQSLQSAWQDKITLQAVSLIRLSYYQTTEGVVLADRIASIGGILGGVAYINPDLDAQLDTVFQLAKERDLDLDFHADENGDPNSICLQKIAQAALRHKYSRQITCGHCCSLSLQSPEIVSKTINLVQQAKISIISLPMCNLYLQDRQTKKTPLWRGVTRVKELKQQGISVALASDNCRDPFFGFGDHDVLEVFEQAVRIAHLDTPYGNWIESVTSTPAKLMGLKDIGKIIPGNAAELIIFPARYLSELLSRSQHNRLILRQGKKINTKLPDYRELDDLVLH